MSDMLFQDADDLTMFLESIALTMLEDTGATLVKEVKKNVESIVYDPYDSLVRVYGRRGENGGFLGSWVYNYEMNPEGNWEVSIFSDADSMVLSPPIHGSAEETLFGDADRRNIMDRIVAEGTDYDFYVPPELSPYGDPPDNWWTRPRDYWSPTIKEAERIIKKSSIDSLRANNTDIKILKRVV